PERYHELIRHDYTGDSAIIDPRGEILTAPVSGETIILAEGSMEAIYAAKAGCDPGGHYSRPDLFTVLVNREPLRRVVEGRRPAGLGEDASLRE
ncbi:MAG: hypothetical protein JNM64_01790, partial [Chloroflexia bacterium]|nr:hypothetical protein [Chloroflexia bacterium]